MRSQYLSHSNSNTIQLVCLFNLKRLIRIYLFNLKRRKIFEKIACWLCFLVDNDEWKIFHLEPHLRMRFSRGCLSNNERVAENCVALNIYEHVAFPPPRHETSKTHRQKHRRSVLAFSFASLRSERENILCCRSKCETSHKPSPSDCLIFYEWKFFFSRFYACGLMFVVVSAARVRLINCVVGRVRRGNGRRYRGINKFAGRASFLLIFRRTESFRFSFAR